MKPNKIVTLLTIAIAAACASAPAQTNSVSASAGATTNAPSIAAGLTQIYDAIASSGLATATNYAAEPYLTYAPDAPSGNKVGGGALIAYNLSQYLAPALEVDYLGQFSLVSVNLTLKVPTHPFRNLPLFNGALTNVAIVPFGLVGVGTPLSGASSGAIAVTDAGAYIGFGHLWGGQFNTGFAYGRWDNAGAYSGARYHLFLGWSKGF
jgi:hypothetical protein